MQKEKQKWEKGKFALKSIVADIDAKIVELGSVGGESLSLPPPLPQYFPYSSQVDDCGKLNICQLIFKPLFLSLTSLL